jgi:hypothetical protein
MHSLVNLLPHAGKAFTFFLFAHPYYFVMPAQKKSKQKRPVQKRQLRSTVHSRCKMLILLPFLFIILDFGHFWQ